VLIAAVSTVVFGVAAYFAVTRSPGWPRVHRSFFDYHDARDAFPSVLKGLWLNIRVLFAAEFFILIVALLVAGARTLRGPVWFPIRALARAYTDFFRGMPLLVMLYLIGFGLPGLRYKGLPTSAAVLGTIALVLVYSAYVAEVFRAGIESVHPSQRAAARSLGLTHGQTLRLVVLPQAVRRVLPPLLNDFVALQKDVGLISVLGAIDAIRQAQIASYATAGYTAYVLAGVLFVLLAVPSVRLADWVNARALRREQSGGVV
jgi:polar amino acid transport system permease protein